MNISGVVPTTSIATSRSGRRRLRCWADKNSAVETARADDVRPRNGAAAERIRDGRARLKLSNQAGTHGGASFAGSRGGLTDALIGILDDCRHSQRLSSATEQAGRQLPRGSLLELPGAGLENPVRQTLISFDSKPFVEEVTHVPSEISGSVKARKEKRFNGILRTRNQILERRLGDAHECAPVYCGPDGKGESKLRDPIRSERRVNRTRVAVPGWKQISKAADSRRS